MEVPQGIQGAWRGGCGPGCPESGATLGGIACASHYFRPWLHWGPRLAPGPDLRFWAIWESVASASPELLRAVSSSWQRDGWGYLASSNRQEKALHFFQALPLLGLSENTSCFPQGPFLLNVGLILGVSKPLKWNPLWYSHGKKPFRQIDIATLFSLSKPGHEGERREWKISLKA